MATDNDKVFDTYVLNLEGKIDLIKLSIIADFNNLPKTPEGYQIFNDNYIKQVKKYKLAPYPFIPNSLRHCLESYAKAMNTGKDKGLGLQSYFETRQAEFLRLLKKH